MCISPYLRRTVIETLAALLPLLVKFFLVSLIAVIVFILWVFNAGAAIRNDQHVPLGLRAAATRTCRFAGIDTLECRNDLLAIAWRESHFGALPVGDGGCSVGLMHLNLCQHPSWSAECALQDECAMQVALSYLLRHNYAQTRFYALRRYNGGAANPKTESYARAIIAYSARLSEEIVCAELTKNYQYASMLVYDAQGNRTLAQNRRP